MTPAKAFSFGCRTGFVEFEFGEHFDSCGEAKMELCDYIKVF